MVAGPHEDDQRLVQLDEALERLSTIAPEKAELVRLRYFAGLKIREAAELLGISTATADRHWAYPKPGAEAVEGDQGSVGR